MRSIKSKLMLVIVIPLICVLVIMFGFSFYAINYLSSTLDAFSNTSIEATTLVLNGDRDFYQALTALQNIEKLSPDDDAFGAEIASYDENAQQATERVNQSVALISDFADADNEEVTLMIEAMQSELDQFNALFGDWSLATTAFIEGVQGSDNEALDNGNDLFDSARNSIDMIGEKIYEISENRIQTTNALIEKIKFYQWLVAALIIAVSSVLAYRISDAIAQPIRNVSQALKKAAEGDFDQTLKSDSEDEIGELVEAYTTIISKVDKVIQEARGMEHDIERGHLNKLANAEQFKGEWKNLMVGVNNVASRLNHYIDISPNVSLTMDNNFNVLYLNQAGRELLGVSGDMAQNMKCHDLLKTEHCGTNECGCAMAMQKKERVKRETMASPKGKEMDVVYDAMPILNSEDQVVGAFEVVVDQTEIKNAARIQEEQSNQLLEASKVSEKQAAFQEREIEKLVENLASLANGNLSIYTSVSEVDDDTYEIGQNFFRLYDSLGEMVGSINAYISDISDALSRMAQRDMDITISREFKGDFGAIKDSIHLIVNAFNEILSELNISSMEVAGGANQVSQTAQALSQGATEQSSALQQISASIIEVADQTKENAQAANETKKLSGTVQDHAEQGNQQMKEMLQAMNEINESSVSISNVIKVIDEIAFQTNILALNAAVEAARAGQHGKGFAVVAEEVRNLAARSANAAKETTQMIEDSIAKVKKGTTIAQQTSEALDSIVAGVDEAGKMVDKIAKASNEQSLAISQINEGVNQVSQVTQVNASSSQQSAAASEEMAALAENLKNQVSTFHLKELSKVRSTGMDYLGEVEDAV